MADGRWTFHVNPHFDVEAAAEFADFLEHNLGPRIQANAKRSVPVRTGDLKRSIIIQVDRNGADSVLQVGVDEEVAGVTYGLHVEQGTSKQIPQPFLRPAVYQARGVMPR